MTEMSNPLFFLCREMPAGVRHQKDPDELPPERLPEIRSGWIGE